MTSEQAPRDSFPPGEAAHTNAAQTAPAASDGAGGFLRSARGASEHREAILDAWAGGMSATDIALVLTEAGATGCSRGSVHQLVLAARQAGDARAAARATPTQRAAVAASNQRRGCSAETRAKMSASLMGHPMSPKTRAKISAAKMGHPMSPETRAKISAAKMGHVTSAEARDNMRAARLAYLARARQA